MKRTHGDTKTRLYRIWTAMKGRCSNKNIPCYKYYGGRGIDVCDEWKTSYQSFKEWAINNGYAEHLSIDRIDFNGNYSPENCRWVTRKEQARNTRKNRFYTIDGETHCMSEWESRFNISHSLIDKRMKIGMSFEDALKTPIQEIVTERIFTFQGESHNIAEWARILGMKEGTLRNRLMNYGDNFTIEQAFTEKTGSRFYHDLNIEYKGEKKHLKEWASEIGIDYSTLRKRIFKLGYSVDDAFTKPVRPTGRK